MSTSLGPGFLPGITPDQLGIAKAATASTTSEKVSKMTSIAPRQHQDEDSFESAWVMIGTILSCLAIMIAVVIASATSIS
jgi:hypothetical protein